MHILRLVPLAFALACGLAFAQARPADPAADLKSLEGTWVMVSGKRDGEPVGADHVGKSRIVWKGADTVVETPHQAKEPIKAKVTLAAPASGPKTIDWTRANGPDAGRVMLALFEFRGPDEYVVVFAPAGKGRPGELDAKKGSGHTMHVWKRVKP